LDKTPSTLLLAPSDSALQKRYRTVGIAMFTVAAGLLLVRTITYLIALYAPVAEENQAAFDVFLNVLFTVLVQVVVLLVAVFLIYKHSLKLKTRGILEFSNVRPAKWYNYALAVPIGILALFVAIGLSAFWRVLIGALGYNFNATSSMPATFSPGLFILEIVLIAVLPAICEEFAMRGGFFTTMKRSFKGVRLYFIMAIAFGLFHQNIRQVFYTAVFGAVMAFLLIKTKSIWPCIIVHFLNNFTSVYLDYAGAYGWFGGSVLDYIFTLVVESFGRALLIYLLILAAFAALLVLTGYLNSARFLKRKKNAILDSGFNHTHGRVVPIGAEDKEKVRELGLEEEVYGQKLPDNLYKPTLRDNAFYIGAIVAAGIFTVFSFIWGLFY